MPTEEPGPQPSDAVEAICSVIVGGLRESKLELPIMPRVASRIFTLTNDPNANMSDLSKLIHSDPSIASHVLRIANAAAYAGGEPIVSLQQAVTRLGMKLLGEIAIAVSLQDGIFKVPGFEEQIKPLLRHALAAAAYGKEISRKRRRNVEGQFLCGLLHSVGKPICLQLIGKIAADRQLKTTPQDIAAIMAKLHAKIAAKVVIDWKLPKQLQVTTVFHSKYETAPSFKDETIATYLSALLAHWALDPLKYNAIELSKNPALTALNFYPDDVQDLLSKKDQVKAVVAAMEI